MALEQRATRERQRNRGSNLLLVHSVARWNQDHPDVTVSTTPVSGDPDAVRRWHLAITAGASPVRPFRAHTNRYICVRPWAVAAEIADYQDSGLEVVGVIGIAGSPSCGVQTTLDLPAAMDVLCRCRLANLDRRDEQRASNWSAHSARARTLCHGAATAVGETRGGRSLRRVRLRLEIQAVAATSFTQAIAVGTSAVPAARQRRHRPG